MARRPARWAVAAGVTVAALSAAAAPAGPAGPLAVAPTASSAVVPSPTTGAASTTGTGTGTATTTVPRTPYERRLLRAGTESLDLAPVVGGHDRPNIVVLMTDDMRDDDLKFMPTTRRLIEDQGVRFVNGFSPHPLCCPARASFLSGRYTHNHGVFSNHAPFAFHAFDDRSTLPVWLRRAGYRTHFVGKYLNGYGKQAARDGSPSLRYVPPGWTQWRAATRVPTGMEEADDSLAGSPYHYFDTTLSSDGRLESHQGRYQTFLYGDLAQDMLRAGARQPAPYLAVVSFTAPHDGKPWEADDVPAGTPAGATTSRVVSPARPGYAKGRFAGRLLGIPGGEDPRDRVGDKPSFVRSRPPLTEQDAAAVLTRYVQRAESLSVVDDEIGNIITALERTGELDNTYVLFTSDNGYFAGEHRRRLGKRLAYEPSLRVPVLLRGPGVPAGEVRTDPFLISDIAPTLRAMGGLPRDPALDGVSLLDVARDGDRGWTRSVLFEGGPRAVPDQTEATMPMTWDGVRMDVRSSLGVRTRRYLYVEHTANGPELYDLRRDPRQRVNLAARPGDRRAMRPLLRLLAAEVARLRDCAGAACSAPAPVRLRTGPPVPPWSSVTLAGEAAGLDSARPVSHSR